MSDIQMLLKPAVVADAIKELDGADPTFSGYLAALAATTSPSRKEPFTTEDVRRFFDRYLGVPGGPLKDGKPRPYFVPWGRTQQGGWTNPNVAGSYAPSSLTDSRPFRKVIDIKGDGRDARYTLKPAHAKIAAEALLGGKRLSSLKLGVFLLRNFAFMPADATADGIREALRNLFHMKAGDADFKLLFHEDDSDFITAASWTPPEDGVDA